MKLYAIVPGLLYQRGRFDHLPGKIKALHEAGIQVVISCWHADPDLVDVVEYVHAPFPDGKRLDPHFVLDVGHRVACEIAASRRTLVHCHGGRNRSALISALALRFLTGCSGTEAMAAIRTARPGALANETFVRYLADLGPTEILGSTHAA